MFNWVSGGGTVESPLIGKPDDMWACSDGSETIHCDHCSWFGSEEALSSSALSASQSKAAFSSSGQVRKFISGTSIPSAGPSSGLVTCEKFCDELNPDASSMFVYMSTESLKGRSG